VARFMLIYRGEATDMEDMSPEDAQAVLSKWQAWMGKVGPALVDVGSPFGPGASLVDDGSTRDALKLTGFSIIEAADAAQARTLADGHPYLAEGRGNYSVEIYELMPTPF
jgi:YCII-related domain